MLAFITWGVIIVSISFSGDANAESPRQDDSTFTYGSRQAQPSQASLIQEADAQGYEVRRTEFIGNARTPDMVLRLRLMFTEGDLFTKEKLKQSIRRLSRLKVINPVRLRDVDIRLDRQNKLIDMAFRVREKRRR